MTSSEENRMQVAHNINWRLYKLVGTVAAKTLSKLRNSNFKSSTFSIVNSFFNSFLTLVIFIFSSRFPNVVWPLISSNVI